MIVDFVDTNVLSSLVCKYVFAYFVSFFITSVKWRDWWIKELKGRSFEIYYKHAILLLYTKLIK